MKNYNPIMPEKKFYKLEGEPEGLRWLSQFSDKAPIPYCEQHEIRLEIDQDDHYRETLFCPFDRKEFALRNTILVQEKMALGMIYKNSIKDLEVIRIDSEGSRVLAKEKVKLLEEYWIETKVSNTAAGVQIMIQIGKRDESGKKVQLFVDPPRERLSFDSNDKDIHPAGIFSKVTSQFKDSVTIIEPNDNNKE